MSWKSLTWLVTSVCAQTILITYKLLHTYSAEHHAWERGREGGREGGMERVKAGGGISDQVWFCDKAFLELKMWTFTFSFITGNVIGLSVES